MNTVYPRARQRLLERFISGGNFTAGEIRALLVGPGYTYNASHETLDDINPADIVGAAVALANVTAVNGVLRADNALFEGLTITDQVSAVIVYGQQSPGTLLLSYQSSATDSSLPATLGADAGLVVWDSSGIFRF